MVDTALEVRLRRAPDREMPLEWLVLKWLRVDKYLLLRTDVLVLLHYPSHRQRRRSLRTHHNSHVSVYFSAK